MISVCIATYNGEKYILEQILSILPQLKENDEIIVSDDSSTDTTLEIIKNINDKRIQIFKNTGNHGVNSNFDNALKRAHGEYIFLSDQDDVWLPGKVDRCLAELRTADLIMHDATIL